MTSSTRTEPVLEKPGAGVPAIERIVGKARLHLRLLTTGRGGADRAIVREREAIRALYASRTPAECAQRVLIPRLRGLEDSSRYWSAWMVLDHLRIVNDQIAAVILSLARGNVPDRESSTAAVKPTEVGEEVVPLYEKSCDHVLRAAARTENLGTEARYAHPWFGPLDAALWHTMAGMHMGIHRAQMKEILRRLPVERK